MTQRSQAIGTLLLYGMSAGCLLSDPVAPAFETNFVPTPSFAISKTIDVTDLGTLGAGAVHVAQGINNQGHVVGTSSDNAGVPHAVFWDPGSAPINLTPSVASYGQDINDNDVAVGRLTNGAGQWEAFSASPGTPPTGLGTFGGIESIAFGVNNGGEIVGRYTDDTGVHAFRWNGSLTTLPTLGAPDFAVAFGINDDGDVVGISSAASDPASPILSFVWSQSGGTRQVPVLGGSYSEHDVFKINRRGEIAGGAFDESSGLWVPFIYTESKGHTPLTTIGFPSSASGIAIDVNVLGHIAVVVLEADGSRIPSVFVEGTGVVPMPVIGGGSGDGEIWAINDVGEIVGWSEDGAGRMRPALWRIAFSSDDRIEDVIDVLDELIDEIGDKDIDDALGKAIKKAEKALKELGKGKVSKGIDEIKESIKEILKAIDKGLDPGIGFDLIEVLTATARELAVDAIDAAIAGGGKSDKIAEAQQHLADGDAFHDQGDHEKAVDEYAKAAKEAEAALK